MVLLFNLIFGNSIRKFFGFNIPMNNQPRYSYARLGKLGECDDKLTDYQHWRELGSEACFDTAWELVICAFELKGRDLDELRFQRSIENICRRKS